VLASPLRLRGGCFELRYRPNEEAKLDGTGARLGLVIPKRLARRAVLRNQIKRLAREAFRQVLPELSAMDLVLRLTKPPLPAKALVDRELRHAWRRDIDSLLAGVPQ
jgi:ribonuclease P protein component